jgi:hypothetical protein
MAAKLNPNIVSYLAKKTGLSPKYIGKEISVLRSDFPSCTPNAVAQIFARKRGISVWGKLEKEDRTSLPVMEAKSRITITRTRGPKKEKVLEVIRYDSANPFIRGHIDEINRAYTKGCYTAVHVLARKIIENLIRELLSGRFPPEELENKELYYDIAQARFKDFNVILRNLYEKRNEFGPGKSDAVKRLYDLAKNFKGDANDATHSWYYLIQSKSEIDNLNIQTIIDLIAVLQES